jgi:hypothetical protein
MTTTTQTIYPAQELECELVSYFNNLRGRAEMMGWGPDSAWTRGINTDIAKVGKRHGFLVFASRCDADIDGPEWLYDHHWRMVNAAGDLVRIPLAMEIEWGFGRRTIREKVVEDYLKLVQSRADLKVMVFACGNVEGMLADLVVMARAFEDRGPEDRFLFAGYDWDTHEITCRAIRV